MTCEILTQSSLKKILSYDESTGNFTWIKKVAPRINIGATAGNKKWDGYMRIMYQRKEYPSHRLAWLYVYGEWPAKHLDHINHDRSDNRISNLCNATPKTNNMNRSMMCTNKSGHVGVYFNKALMKWRSFIWVDGKEIHLGYFVCITAAIIARSAASIKYGYHQNHGK